jgi:hypothetical protein
MYFILFLIFDCAAAATHHQNNLFQFKNLTYTGYTLVNNIFFFFFSFKQQDKNRNNPEAASMFEKVREAYEVVGDPDKRILVSVLLVVGCAAG